MLTVFMTFLFTLALVGALLVFAFRKVTAHLQGNTEATKHVVEHVLIPLLGRKPEVPAEEETQQDQGKESEQ